MAEIKRMTAGGEGRGAERRRWRGREEERRGEKAAESR